MNDVYVIIEDSNEKKSNTRIALDGSSPLMVDRTPTEKILVQATGYSEPPGAGDDQTALYAAIVVIPPDFNELPKPQARIEVLKVLEWAPGHVERKCDYTDKLKALCEGKLECSFPAAAAAFCNGMDLAPSERKGFSADFRCGARSISINTWKLYHLKCDEQAFSVSETVQ